MHGPGSEPGPASFRVATAFRPSDGVGDISALAGPDRLGDFRAWLASHEKGRIALDTEGNGLWPWLRESITRPGTPGTVVQEPYRCTHVAIASDDGTAWVADGSDRDLTRRALRFLPEARARVWAHNAGYDRDVLKAAFGLDIALSDSLTLVKALRPGLGSYSLKELRPDTDAKKTALHRHFRELHPLDPAAPGVKERLLPALKALGLEEDVLAELKKSGPAERFEALTAFSGGDPVTAMIAVDHDDWLPEAFERLPFTDPLALEYVATDAAETALMVAEMGGEPPLAVTETSPAGTAGRVRAFNQARQAALAEVDVQRVYDQSSSRGWLINLPELQKAEGKLADAKAAMVEKWGVDLTTNSDATRKWVADRGISIKDRDGKETLSAKFYGRAVVPEEHREDWEEFRGLRDPEHGGIAAAANFLTGVRKNLAVAPDGTARVHGKLKGLGTDTGRTASTDPNLQNVTPSMRPLFLAEPGCILAGADFDQVEPRVVAAMSGDPAMIEAVQSADPYSSLAVSVWGGEAARPSGPEHDPCRDETRMCAACRAWAGYRKKAKVSLLALQYGQGPPSMAAGLKISEAEARRVKQEFGSGFPVLAKWSRKVIAETEAGGYFLTGYGRPLPRPRDVSPSNPREFTRSVNWRVQGTASDIFKRAVLRAARLLGAGAVWMVIHDELIVQVPDTTEWRVKALDALRDAMNFDFLGVPVSAEPELLGPVWGKLGMQPAEYRFWEPPARALSGAAAA